MNKSRVSSNAVLSKIYRRIADDCPEWWKEREKPFNALLFVVDGICNMLARDKYSNKEIAAYWECPVGFVNAVKRLKEEIIEKLRKELSECEEFARKIADHPTEGGMVSEEEAITALCEAILMDYQKREKEMRK